MSQLFCKNLNVKIFANQTHMKCLLKSTLGNRQLSYFSYIKNMIPKFRFFAIIRQNLINNRNLIFNAIKSKSNLLRNKFKNKIISAEQCKKLYALSFTAGLFSWVYICLFI